MEQLGRRRSPEMGELGRVRAGVVLVSCVALAALLAVVTSGGRVSLLQWGPPSMRPPSNAEKGEAFVWGPPRMRPLRARTQEGAAAPADPPAVTTRGRSSRMEHSGERLPSIRVEVNQNDDRGDRIAPVNINIQLPETGLAPAFAQLPRHVLPAQPAVQAKRATLNSKSAVDEIDADGDAPVPAHRVMAPVRDVPTDDSVHVSGDVFSPADPGTAVAEKEDESGSESSSNEEHQAAAAFSPQDSGRTSKTAEPPALPAMWLVGSQGQPHPPHDDKATDGGAGGKIRSGKHAKDVKARAKAAAKLQAIRMSQLSQLSSAELQSDHMEVNANGFVVVPLPDLKTMPGRKLVALEQGLKFEEQDARDSATSMAGMDRAKALSWQIELVRARMQHLPVEIEKELAKNEEAIAKRQRDIQVLMGDVEDEQQNLDATRKEEGPKKLRDEERTMQGKVELQRAAASALADLSGKSAPTFAKLTQGADADTEVVAENDADQESIPHQAKELKMAKADLSSATSALAALQKTRDALLKDIAATHKALGSDAETDAYGNQVGGEEWLKQEEQPAELAPKGRVSMLAEDAQTDTASGGLLHNASEAWDSYMDENDPSHIDEGDVRHALRKGLAQGSADIAAGVEKMADGKWRAPNFKTIDPRHGVHKVHTPPKVKQLANKGVGVGKEGPKLQFCQWGSELVPCAPGYGGAWIGDHPQDSGIWGGGHIIPAIVKPKIREHVKAGQRSAPYLADMFSYGKAGIFGARHQRGGAAAGSVYKGPMLNGAKENQRKVKTSLAPQKGGKYIENTQLPHLVKQEWDWHLNRKNPVSPEFVDTLLESGKQIHLAKRLDFGNSVKAAGWDNLAAKNAGIVHGIVSPAEVDAMLDRDAVAHTGLSTQMPGKKTVHDDSGWVNEGAKNSARVFGIVNPQEVDHILDKQHIEGALHIPTTMPGHEQQAQGWVSAAAKQSAAVFGIVNPNAVDSLISREAIAKKGTPTEMSGKDRKADGWINEAAKSSATVFGIINPNTMDRTISKEAVSKAGTNTEIPAKKDSGPAADGWVNAGAKHAARVHGILNPNLIDKILDKAEVKASGIPTEVRDKKIAPSRDKDWVSEGAKNAARVWGILNPNTQDRILNKEEIKKIPGMKVETDGKGERAPGWTGMDARNAASVFGIVNPSDIENVLEGGQLAAVSGPLDENVPRGAVGGSGPEQGEGGKTQLARALDAKLHSWKSAEMRKLNRIAAISLS